jgi:hypothetical protein
VPVNIDAHACRSLLAHLRRVTAWRWLRLDALDLRADGAEAVVDPLVARSISATLPITERPFAQSAAMSIAIPARMSGLVSRWP